MAKRNIIPLFIPHAGCSHRCVFCDQVQISGADTPVTPALASAPIQAALPAAGMGCELAFYGGSFTALPAAVQRRLLEAAVPYRADGRISCIRLSTRPDAIDDAACALLKEYGVTTVELGCQSMDEGVLALTRRGHSSEDTVMAVHCLRRHGFQVILQMMTGLPGDTGRESRETAEKIIALNPDGVRIYPTVVLRNTELARMMEAGEYRPQSVETAVSLCADLYQRFLENDIPVIRLGLNPTEELSGGEVLAGAYHPALGELVLSEIFLRMAREKLRTVDPLERAELLVHPSRISVMVGQKRRNLTLLQREFSMQRLKVRAGDIGIWDIAVDELES